MTEQSFNAKIRRHQLRINYAIRCLQRYPDPIRKEFWNNRIKQMYNAIVIVVNNYNEGGLK